jgi:hypothetical protein
MALSEEKRWPARNKQEGRKVPLSSEDLLRVIRRIMMSSGLYAVVLTG